MSSVSYLKIDPLYAQYPKKDDGKVKQQHNGIIVLGLKKSNTLFANPKRIPVAMTTQGMFNF